MFVELSQFINFDTVSYGCIRQWILRLGLGLLQAPVKKRKDWIYIVDFSIQLGKERCLLILGTTKQTLQENGYKLQHCHVCVLDLYICEQYSADVVKDRILLTSDKTGIPAQIISDKGADIVLGVEKFGCENNYTLHSNDISHMIGNVLRHHLQKDEQWISLHEDLKSLTCHIKQTELSFLRPVAGSVKSRWMNIGKEIEYLENLFRYESKGDFSLISEEVKIDNYDEIFDLLKDKCNNKNEKKRLAKELQGKFRDKYSVVKQLKENYSLDIDNVNIKVKDAGLIRYEEKFGLLNKHKEYFKELKEIHKIAEGIKYTIREKGLSLDSLQEIELLYEASPYPRVMKIFNDINNHLQLDHSKFGIEKMPVLCCSEVIESIFGKFKMKSKQVVGGIYQSVLSIAVICSQITPEKIVKILSEIKMEDVDNWFLSMSGVSNLAKRRRAFNDFT